ncbi:RES family NAD+ phosphorylase [Massilia sp. W12]|uniref:RES family NAD+ phosphorylase n=1 Tax=Massilia sp. W12 TaxID=3126507 RepID=UPI0030CD648F
MAALELDLPPAGFANYKHKTVYLPAQRLLRISRFETGEPWFGANACNRFDAPDMPPSYAACYFALSLDVALAETVLHDAIPCDGLFHIAAVELRQRWLFQFEGENLRLADLTGAALKRMGAHAGLGGSADYAVTRQWALGVFQNPAEYDGLLYMSRHVNTGKAVVLFSRAQSKIRVQNMQALFMAPGLAASARRLGLRGA